jgi:hypothetical protein
LWKTFVEFAVRDFETLRGLQGMDGERVQFDDEISKLFGAPTDDVGAVPYRPLDQAAKELSERR